MEALQGYGSSSDSDVCHPGGSGEPRPQQQQQQSADKQRQPQRPGSNAAPPPQPGVGGLKLPSAAELFGTGAQPASLTPAGLRAAGGAVQKRQQPHGLRAGQPLPAKAQKGASGARPACGGSGALVPPQLRGRANVVTEDLDRLFTRKAKSPQAEGAGLSGQQAK